MDRWTPFLWEMLECRKCRDVNSIHLWELSTGITPPPRKKKENIFRKTLFPKEEDSKAITPQRNTIIAPSQVMSSHFRLKSIMSNHRRTMKSQVLRPFVWLSLSISVSIHPFHSFSTPVSFCPSLSASSSLHKFSRRLRERSPLISMHTSFFPSLQLGAPSCICNSQTIDHLMKSATITQPF